MNVARAKLDLIKPEEVNMDEYEVSGDLFFKADVVTWLGDQPLCRWNFSGTLINFHLSSSDLASGLQEFP